MNSEEFFSTWSGLHGNAKISGIVKAWLSISYLIVKPISKVRITPNILTILGLFFGLLLFLNANTFWAPGLLVLSLICDGIDGSLAILTKKSTKLGAILDSVVDRLTEIFWVLALYKIGADLKLLVIVLLTASLQEYVRARSAGLGVSEVGIVTFAERPVRASFVFVVFISLQFDFTIYNQVILFWLVLQLLSLFTLVRFTYSKLR
jgi:archaetidylinositol phosphate synthase